MDSKDNPIPIEAGIKGECNVTTGDDNSAKSSSSGELLVTETDSLESTSSKQTGEGNSKSISSSAECEIKEPSELPECTEDVASSEAAAESKVEASAVSKAVEDKDVDNLQVASVGEDVEEMAINDPAEDVVAEEEVIEDPEVIRQRVEITRNKLYSDLRDKYEDIDFASLNKFTDYDGCSFANEFEDSLLSEGFVASFDDIIPKCLDQLFVLHKLSALSVERANTLREYIRLIKLVSEEVITFRKISASCCIESKFSIQFLYQDLHEIYGKCAVKVPFSGNSVKFVTCKEGMLWKIYSCIVFHLIYSAGIAFRDSRFLACTAYSVLALQCLSMQQIQNKYPKESIKSLAYLAKNYAVHCFYYIIKTHGTDLNDTCVCYEDYSKVMMKGDAIMNCMEEVFGPMEPQDLFEVQDFQTWRTDNMIFKKLPVLLANTERFTEFNLLDVLQHRLHISLYDLKDKRYAWHFLWTKFYFLKNSVINIIKTELLNFSEDGPQFDNDIRYEPNEEKFKLMMERLLNQIFEYCYYIRVVLSDVTSFYEGRPINVFLAAVPHLLDIVKRNPCLEYIQKFYSKLEAEMKSKGWDAVSSELLSRSVIQYLKADYIEKRIPKFLRLSLSKLPHAEWMNCMDYEMNELPAGLLKKCKDSGVNECDKAFKSLILFCFKNHILHHTESQASEKVKQPQFEDIRFDLQKYCTQEKYCRLFISLLCRSGIVDKATHDISDDVVKGTKIKAACWTLFFIYSVLECFLNDEKKLSDPELTTESGGESSADRIAKILSGKKGNKNLKKESKIHFDVGVEPDTTVNTKGLKKSGAKSPKKLLTSKNYSFTHEFNPESELDFLEKTLIKGESVSREKLSSIEAERRYFRNMKELPAGSEKSKSILKKSGSEKSVKSSGFADVKNWSDFPVEKYSSLTGNYFIVLSTLYTTLWYWRFHLATIEPGYTISDFYVKDCPKLDSVSIVNKCMDDIIVVLNDYEEDKQSLGLKSLHYHLGKIMSVLDLEHDSI